MNELHLAKNEYYMDDFIEFLDKMMTVYIPEAIDSKVSLQEKYIIKANFRNKYFMCFDTNNYQFSYGIDLKKISVVAYDPYLYTFDQKDRVTHLFERKKNYF